jgi:DNA-binding NarL/FixJ family response regulator
MKLKSLSQTEIKNLANSLNLTETDIKVIELICKEYGSPEIAVKLKLSPRTIEGIRFRMLQKIKAKNVVGIVKFAIKNKIYTIGK